MLGIALLAGLLATGGTAFADPPEPTAVPRERAISHANLDRGDDREGDRLERLIARARLGEDLVTKKDANLTRPEDPNGVESERKFAESARRFARLARVKDTKGDEEERKLAKIARTLDAIDKLKKGTFPKADVGISDQDEDERNQREHEKRVEQKGKSTNPEARRGRDLDREDERRLIREDASRERATENRREREDDKKAERKEKKDEKKSERDEKKKDAKDEALRERADDRKDRREESRTSSGDGLGTKQP